MMFLDYLYAFPNSSGGLDGILTSTSGTLTPILLVFVFFLVWLGGIWRESARVGSADYSFWSVLASISTLILALLMSVKEGLISGNTLGVVVAITIFTGVWYFLDRGDVSI
jgi:hypothetical protein